MSAPTGIRIRSQPLVPGGGPFIFGVLNVTPDSFSDGGAYATTKAAVEAGCRMADEGADVVDVGGESTRPGSLPVPPDEQIRRTVDVVAALSRRFGSTGPGVSIDTRSARVAGAAIDAGATLVNDVSALRFDPDMAGLAARRGIGLVLMHARGDPVDMQVNPAYENLIDEIIAFLSERVAFAERAGVRRERMIVDPGIGFGKAADHNLQIIRRIGEFREIGLPVLVGPSRKRFIGQVLGIEEPQERLIGTVAAVSACVLAGVECVRVHDVRACRQAADLCAAIRRGSVR
jgi:dihydropteroate synthase